jgi:hypothetical protein
VVWLRNWNDTAVSGIALGNGPKGQAMDLQLGQWRSASSQRLWLSLLIDTAEEISRPERRAEPCDRQVITAVRAQLARPARLPIPYASPYSLRN